MSKHFKLETVVHEPPRRTVEQPPEPHKATTCLTKRSIDVSIALAALLFLSPLILLVSIAIVLDSKGPIFFRQHRTGLGGQPFRIYKFRTMKVVEDGASIRHASKDDDRVTDVGRFLRRSHWDELPQLINVLKGDMALIGPRPHAVAHDQFYGSAFPEYQRRFRVRPGLTGLAQVHGHRGEVFSLDCMKKRIDADLDYVESWSVGLDLLIAVKTVPLLLCDTKAY